MAEVKSLNVAVFSINDRRGGAENILKLTALHFKSKGYKVEVVVFKRTNSKFWNKDGFEVCLFIPFILSNLFSKKRFRYAFSTHLKMNACLGVLRKFYFLRSDYFIARESTRIFSRYIGFKLWYSKFLYFLGYRQMDLIICQNELMQLELIRNIDFFGSIKSCVISNPLDQSKILELSDEHCDVSDIKDCFVAVGRLIPEKGFDNLIRSISYADILLPKLYIIGEGPENENLNQIIEEHDLSDRVLLLGYIENPYPYMKNALGCILSSRVEGFPNVLNEMISLNSNVLTSFCVPEVESLDFVLKEDINDIVEFSKALVRLASEPPKLNGRSHYIESLNPGHFFLSLESNLIKQ